MGKRGPKSHLPVYQFDLEGNLIYMHKTLEIAAENLLMGKHHLFTCIKQKTCYHKKWYFSRKKDFSVPVKKINFNPLLTRKGKGWTNDLPDFDLTEEGSDSDE